MLNATHEKHIVLKGIETCAGEWMLRWEAQNNRNIINVILSFPAKNPQGIQLDTSLTTSR